MNEVEICGFSHYKRNYFELSKIKVVLIRIEKYAFWFLVFLMLRSVTFPAENYARGLILIQ